MNLPNFLIIGAMKSGTTSLYDYLKRHPAIGMSSPKEPNYFVEELGWKNGPEWYEKCFSGCTGRQSIGEASTNYTKYPRFEGVPERIYKTLGPVKLIYVVRDPVERLLSHYLHAVHHRYEKRPFSEMVHVLEESTYGFAGRYHAQLEQYCPFFPMKDILVVDQHDLYYDRPATLRTIFDFLNVNPDFYSKRYDEMRNESRNLRERTWLGKVFLNEAGERRGWKKNEISPAFAQLLTRPLERPRIKRDDLRVILDYYRDDVQKLRRVSGMTFATWSI